MDGDHSDDVTSFSLACKLRPRTAVPVTADVVQLLSGHRGRVAAAGIRLSAGTVPAG